MLPVSDADELLLTKQELQKQRCLIITSNMLMANYYLANNGLEQVKGTKLIAYRLLCNYYLIYIGFGQLHSF